MELNLDTKPQIVMNSRIVNAQSAELALNRSICASFPPLSPPLLDDAGGIVIARIDISIIVRLRYYRAGILSRNRNSSRIRSIFLCYLPRLPRWWRLSSEWRIITANRRTIAGRRGRIKVHEEGAKETGNWIRLFARSLCDSNLTNHHHHPLCLSSC